MEENNSRSILSCRRTRGWRCGLPAPWQLGIARRVERGRCFPHLIDNASRRHGWLRGLILTGLHQGLSSCPGTEVWLCRSARKAIGVPTQDGWLSLRWSSLNLSQVLFFSRSCNQGSFSRSQRVRYSPHGISLRENLRALPWAALPLGSSRSSQWRCNQRWFLWRTNLWIKETVPLIQYLRIETTPNCHLYEIS